MDEWVRNILCDSAKFQMETDITCELPMGMTRIHCKSIHFLEIGSTDARSMRNATWHCRNILCTDYHFSVCVVIMWNNVLWCFCPHNNKGLHLNMCIWDGFHVHVEEASQLCSLFCVQRFSIVGHCTAAMADLIPWQCFVQENTYKWPTQQLGFPVWCFQNLFSYCSSNYSLAV